MKLHYYISWAIRIALIGCLAYIVARLTLQLFFWLPEFVKVCLLFLALLTLAALAIIWIYIAYVEDFFDRADDEEGETK